MASGARNIVYDIHSLTGLMPRDTKIGVWWVGHHIHEGHLRIREVINHHCDFLVGIYLNNFYQIIKHTTGFDTGSKLEFDHETAMAMMDRCDVLLLSDGPGTEYPIIGARDQTELRTSSLPLYISSNERTMALLRVSQSILRKTKEVTGYKVHAGCIKDYWRPYSAAWARKYLGLEYYVEEPMRDSYGNACSASAKEFQEKEGQFINFKILVPGLREIKDVNERLRKYGVDKIECVDFIYDQYQDTAFARFQAGSVFWSDSIRRPYFQVDRVG